MDQKWTDESRRNSRDADNKVFNLKYVAFSLQGLLLSLFGFNLRNKWQLQCGRKKGKKPSLCYCRVGRTGRHVLCLRSLHSSTCLGQGMEEESEWHKGGFPVELKPHLSSPSLHEEQPVYYQILFILFKDCHWDNNDYTWFHYRVTTELDLQSSFWERKEMLEDRAGRKANPLIHVTRFTKHQLPTVLSQLGKNILVQLVSWFCWLPDQWYIDQKWGKTLWTQPYYR